MQNDIPSDSSNLAIEKINTLPSLSPVVQKISAVIADPDVSANDVVDVLKLDPAIASKVLRLANSAYIGMPRTVSSLQNAVVILGQRRIHSLVLAASTLSALKPDNSLPFSYMRFWKHSVTVAIICESIARHLKRYDPIEAGEVFCGGILHDIGKLVLGVYDSERIVVAYRQAIENKTPFFINEDEKTSHMRIGSLVAKHWNFPQSLINAIMYHHTPEDAEEFKRSVAIVHISDIMAHLIGLSTVLKEAIPKIDENSVSRIRLEPERLRVIANDALENEKKLETLVGFFS